MRQHTITRCLAGFAMVLALTGHAFAQSVTLNAVTRTGTIAANGQSVELTVLDLAGGGIGSVKVQTLDTYSGTWEVQCSVDGTTYDTASELKLTATDSTSVIYSVTDTVAIWDVGNAFACQKIRVIATAGFAATNVTVAITATQSGGGGGGGGGGTGLTDTELRATAVPVTCGDCSGSGVSHQDDAAFTVAMDDIVPIAGVYQATPDSVNDGDAGAVRMTAARILLVDGAGGTFPVSATNLDVQIGGSDTVAVSNAGTFATQAAQSGTWTVQPGNTANTTAWLVTGTGGTFPVTATNLDVQIGGSDTVAVSNAGLTELAAAINASVLDVNIVSGAGSGGTALADDADFTAGTTSFTPVGGFYQSTVTACTDGDTCTAGITTGRALKVALSNADGSLATYATDKTEDTQEAGADTGPLFLSVRRDAAASSANASADFATVNTDILGLLWTRQLDPCSGVAKSFFVVDIADGTNTEIANSVASQFFYICSVNLVSAGATVVLISQDDTDGCGSPEAGLNGGSSGTTTEGWSFAANGGIALGNGSSAVMKTSTAARYLCIDQSASVQLSGTISYVSAP